jgi:hypothetical protein
MRSRTIGVVVCLALATGGIVATAFSGRATQRHRRVRS